MDSTRQPIGVATMVYEDYFFLKRWYDYYKAQLGAENLYIFSHGGDPEHRRIAPDASVITVPRDPSMYKFDRRRWRMMSRFTSGLLDFYNWMILTDVDEIVLADPDLAPDLPSYITTTYGGSPNAPRNISPFALELIHVPEHEPQPIEDGATILSRRRIFRPNRNYSKPCLFKSPTTFGPGGHRNDLGRRHLSEGLYLLHLKYFDRATLEARAEEKRRTVVEANKLNAAFSSGHQWSKTTDAYAQILAETTVAGEDILLPDYRAAMQNQIEKYTNQFIWGPASSDKLYRIPERFAQVF